MARQVLATPLLSALLLTVLLPSAYAHPDFRVADGTFEIAHGGFVEFPIRVHFHRLVGDFEVVSPASGTVTIMVTDKLAFDEYSAGRSVPLTYSSAKTNSGSLNFLIACCVDKPFPYFNRPLPQDYEGNYTMFHLVVDNRASTTPATVRLRAVLIHDDPGVVLYDAEPLAAFQGGGFFALLGGLMALYFRRSIRRSTVSSRQEVPSNKPRLLCLASLALFSFASVLGLFLGIRGSRSYGGGLFEGVVASAADLQLPGGPFGATVFTLNAFIFLPWISGLLLWLKSFSMIVAGSRLAGVVGLVYAIGSLVVGLLLALSYEPILVSFLTTATLSIPLIAGGLHLMSQPQKTLG